MTNSKRTLEFDTPYLTSGWDTWEPLENGANIPTWITPIHTVDLLEGRGIRTISDGRWLRPHRRRHVQGPAPDLDLPAASGMGQDRQHAIETPDPTNFERLGRSLDDHAGAISESSKLATSFWAISAFVPIRSTRSTTASVCDDERTMRSDRG